VLVVKSFGELPRLAVGTVIGRVTLGALVFGGWGVWSWLNSDREATLELPKAVAFAALIALIMIRGWYAVRLDGVVAA
jgi:hypothetical protein|tara:strand:- start:219 stop:452 length:234 start_codon:yes stop_codon:yes gene_type:complete